jgi:hypothetical protein
MDLCYCLCILVFTFFVRIVSPLVFVCFSRVLVVDYLSIFLNSVHNYEAIFFVEFIFVLILMIFLYLWIYRENIGIVKSSFLEEWCLLGCYALWLL